MCEDRSCWLTTEECLIEKNSPVMYNNTTCLVSTTTTTTGENIRNKLTIIEEKISEIWINLDQHLTLQHF